MAKAKYQFNPKTLSFERVDNTIRHWANWFLSHLLTGVLTGLACFIIFALFIESPREKRLRSEREQLEAQYEILNAQLDEVQSVLTDIQQRDDNLYRLIVQADPVGKGIRMGSGDQNKYKDLRARTNSEIASSTAATMDRIRRQLFVQSTSFDEVVNLARNKEDMLLCIPAIQPVMNKNLKRMASGYGYRIDPIYKTPKFHAGMDFSGEIGTNIFATGKGVIDFRGWMQGYGNVVIVDHGYGYKTLYGHLNSFVNNLRVGSPVVRGQVIAYMGNTGKSTGPHVHYEVRYKGKVVDPRNYYYMDLSPKQYDEMIQIVSNNGNIFD